MKYLLKHVLYRFLCLEFAAYPYGYLLKISQKNYLKKNMETNSANSKRKF